MKTFLKVLLVVIAVFIAIKLLPITLFAACILGGAALAVLVAGVSAAALVVCLAAALIAVLSPIWLPILAIVGLVLLIKRATRAA